MNSKIVTFAVMLGVLSGAGAWASETADESESQGAEWFVGGGVIVSSKPQVGVDASVYPIPAFGYEGKRLYLRGIVGGYRLFQGERWSVGPIVRPRFEGYSADDSPALAGMRDRGLSFDAGVEASWLADWGLIGVSIVTDALGKHHGQEAELSYTALFPVAGFDVIPSAALRWRSSNLVDYYYGVRPEEARPGRPAYQPGDTIAPLVRLTLRRELSEKWSALGLVQYEWLGSAITDSPIVEDDFITSFMLGVTYTF